MSDHEGAGHDNWEDMSLPGGPSFSITSRRGQESIDRGIRPVGAEGQQTLLPTPVAIAPRPQVNPGYRPRIQAITGIAQRPGGVQNRKAYVPPEPIRPPVDNEARHACQQNSSSTAHHDLTVPWKSFLRNISAARRQTSSQVARDRLDEICHRTNTYIKTPTDDSFRVEIWGTEEDAQRALAELQIFEQDTRETGPRPSRGLWVKQHAHDGRVEDRAIRNLRERELNAARYELNKQTRFEFQLHLLWPPRMDMQRFRQKYEQEVLRPIQAKSLCRIDFHDEGVKYVKISTHEERDMYPIYHRVLNMLKESIGQDGLFSRINRFRLPRSTLYRNKIGLDKFPNSNLFIPTLFGDPLDRSEVMQWEQLCRQADRSNHAMLKTELDSIIRTLQAPGQHVRMRVMFTELGFSRWESAPNGQEYHDFDEFCQMLTKPVTDIEPAGLRGDADLGQLVDILSKMEQFGEPETRYTLHFDFRGSNNSTLRYEREMYIGLQDELEDEANRWMQFFHAQNENEVLEFNLLDFEHLRANYQVHIGKTPLYEPKDSKEQNEHKRTLQSFSSKVSYSHARDGFKAPIKRRAIFPVGHSTLVGHEERIIARFNFKGPDARFELIRRDRFDARVSGTRPTRTTWVAQYYYPHWDTLLGEFGNLQPGEKVSWPKCMQSFFIPENSFEDSRPLPKGFKAFMNEIEEIQEILQAVIQQLPGVSTNGGRDGVNSVISEVNGMTIG